MDRVKFIKKLREGGSFTLTIEKKPYDIVSFYGSQCKGVILPGNDKPCLVAISEERDGKVQQFGYRTIEELLEHQTEEGFTLGEQIQLYGTKLETDTF